MPCNASSLSPPHTCPPRLAANSSDRQAVLPRVRPTGWRLATGSCVLRERIVRGFPHFSRIYQHIYPHGYDEPESWSDRGPRDPPSWQRWACQCDCTTSKTRIRPGEPPLVSQLTGAILMILSTCSFLNPSLADARRRRQRLCGAASNSATAGPLLASLSKRRVASVFRLRLLGEARATRSVLHVKSVLRWRQSTAPPGTDRSRRVQVIRYLFEACRA